MLSVYVRFLAVKMSLNAIHGIVRTLSDEATVQERVSKIATISGHVLGVGAQIKTLSFHTAARVVFGMITKHFIICLCSLLLHYNTLSFPSKYS